MNNTTFSADSKLIFYPEHARVVAVVAERADRAEEVTRQFAQQGEAVDARWYANSRALCEEAQHPKFEAVILFPDRSPEVLDADEMEIRHSLVQTPLFRVA